MNGYDTYDYGARGYYAAIGRFTTLDPMAEKYYSISPYAYVGNRFMIAIDPTGMLIRTGFMSDEERKKYEERLAELREQSKLFNTMYTQLENSETEYNIKFGDVGEDRGGGFNPNDNSITFDKSNLDIPDQTLSEELFHAYQFDNDNDYINNHNIEFEARVFFTVVETEVDAVKKAALPQGASVMFSSMFGKESRGMEDFQHDINNGTYSDSQNVISQFRPGFYLDYFFAANQYAQYNIDNNFGNSWYKAPTITLPFSLMKVTTNTVR